MFEIDKCFSIPVTKISDMCMLVYVIVWFFFYDVVYDHRLHYIALLGISDMVCFQSCDNFCIPLVNVFTPCPFVLH